MRGTESVVPIVLAGLAGFVVRGAATFVLLYVPWWGSHFIQLFGRLHQAGFVNQAWRIDPGRDVFHCLAASVFPAVVGGLIGALAGFCGGYRAGAAIGALLSMLVVAGACLTAFCNLGARELTSTMAEASRFLAEAAVVGALSGVLSVAIGNSWRSGSAD